MSVPAAGSLVVAFLHSPKERVWGVLQTLEVTGVWLEGIDLASFEDWARQVNREREQTMGLSVIFFPLGRVEKILLDRSGPGQPSMADRFQDLVGMQVEEYLGLRDRETPV